MGWFETVLAENDDSKISERDELDCLSEEQLRHVQGCSSVMPTGPAEAQQDADKEAVACHAQWASEPDEVEDIKWPEDMRPAPPELWGPALLAAATTFPIEKDLAVTVFTPGR